MNYLEGALNAERSSGKKSWTDREKFQDSIVTGPLVEVS